MEELLKCIEENTFNNTKEMQECIGAMVCRDDDYIVLSEEKITAALQLPGEFFVLRLHYKDYEKELQDQKIKYKLSQSLSAVVMYEDDGNSYAEIEKFVKYIYANTDEKQNAIFGIKKLEKLSQYPITILFSGILPINQLQMSIGKKIYDLIHSDDEYFQPKFAYYRDAISKDIGIPLLPVLPRLDETLDPMQVRLVDAFDKRVISEFMADEELSKSTIDKYLQKLAYVYKALMQEKKYTRG
jgi:hypothetical protein